MRVLVIGARGKIGRYIVPALQSRGHEVYFPGRESLDLLDLPEETTLAPDVIYIAAAITTFIDCEAERYAYRVNVDGPLAVARLWPKAKIIFLSSEAVERALHTNYGHMKESAELALRTVTDPVIVRLSKVYQEHVFDCAEYLASLIDKKPGTYYWPSQKPITLSGASMGGHYRS